MLLQLSRQLFAKAKAVLPPKKGTKLQQMLQKATLPQSLTPLKSTRIVQAPTIAPQDISVRKLQLTPHQIWLLSTKSMERPFTGHLWSQKDPGYYSCAVCGTRVFTWDHKYFPSTGMASFWGHIKGRVNTIEQQAKFDQVNYARQGRTQTKHSRVECSTCNSHLGVVFNDGPAPTMLRYSINSASLEFKKLENFPDPNIARSETKRKQELKKFIPIK